MPGAKDRVLRLYYNLTDIVALLAELVQCQKLTDEVLLQVGNLSVNLMWRIVCKGSIAPSVRSQVMDE